MNYVNYDHIVEQLRDANFIIHDLVVGKRQRPKVEGLSQKGWYQLYEMPLDDGRLALTGSFGWWIGGEKFIDTFVVKIDGKKPKFDENQRAAMKARADAERQRAEAERARVFEAAARKASGWWRRMHDAGRSGYMV